MANGAVRKFGGNWWITLIPFPAAIDRQRPHRRLPAAGWDWCGSLNRHSGRWRNNDRQATEDPISHRRPSLAMECGRAASGGPAAHGRSRTGPADCFARRRSDRLCGTWPGYSRPPGPRIAGPNGSGRFPPGSPRPGSRPAVFSGIDRAPSRAIYSWDSGT